MMDWVARTPALLRAAQQHPTTGDSPMEKPLDMLPATTTAVEETAAMKKQRGGTAAQTTTTGVVPTFGRVDSNDTASSSASSPRAAAEEDEDDFESATVPQSVPTPGHARHLNEETEEDDEMEEAAGDPGIVVAPQGVTNNVDVAPSPCSSSPPLLSSPLSSFSLAATASTLLAPAPAAVSAAVATVSRRKRAFAAPPMRLPTLDSVACENGMIFHLGLGENSSRVIKRNYRRKRVNGSRRRRRNNGVSSSTKRRAAEAAAEATAAASAVTSSKTAGGKRLRDRSNIRRPQRPVEDDADVDADVDMALGNHTDDELPMGSSTATPVPPPQQQKRSHKAKAAKPVAVLPRTSPVQYPPAYVSTGPGKPRKQKQCACCATTSTPLWRDIGRKLPLCNACGIRYKKYGLICSSCNYVPCKQERTSKICRRCTTKLPPASNKARLPASGGGTGVATSDQNSMLPVTAASHLASPPPASATPSPVPLAHFQHHA